MLLGYPISEIALLALWIVAAGVLVGILAGLFGIGGGAIIVPVLYEVFRVLGVPEDVRIQACIGTSLAIIVPTTVRSYLGHKKKGSVIPEVVRIWALPAIVGVAIGSVTASFAPAFVFKIAFLVFVSFIAIRMLFGGERWKLGDQLPGRGMLAIYGLITGLFSSLVGVSGGRGRADHDRGDVWLHARRLATHGTTAAFFRRLRLARWAGFDGAGLELHDKLWCTLGALAAAPKTGNCIWRFSDSGCTALCRQHDLASFRAFRAYGACRRALPSFPDG
jgi:sulfite exporter TauE/SafE